MIKALSILVLVALAMGCQKAPVKPSFELFDNKVGQKYAVKHTGQDKVEITYLGAGGYIVRRGKDAIAMSPFLSSPPFIAINPVTSIKPDHEKIDRFLPNIKDVEWILVGHGHYDHLLDIPYIAKNHAPDATVFLNKTSKHMIASQLDSKRMKIMNNFAANNEDYDGRWIYSKDKTMRVLPIESGHSSQFMGIKVMKGELKKDLPEPPRTAFGWIEGKPMVYLIDFLHADGSVDYRIYYQDAAADAPEGFIPPRYKDEYARVDVAIFCVGAYGESKDYPNDYLYNTVPKHIILGHWEDMFDNVGKKEQKGMRLTDIDEFIRRLNDTKPVDSDWLVPDLFSTMYFPNP